MNIAAERYDIGDRNQGADFTTGWKEGKDIKGFDYLAVRGRGHAGSTGLVGERAQGRMRSG
jgi:hypothetical protein